MKLNELVSQINVWEKWRNDYKKYIPEFINEAATSKDWSEWDKDTFSEFFERSNGQCVSSLRQGYFTKNEQKNIKLNWSSIAPTLAKIANSQDVPLWDEYKKLQQDIRKLTESNRKAATYRLIAGLQPNLLCTVVNHDNLRQIYAYLEVHIEEELPRLQDNWFKDSAALFEFYKSNLPDIAVTDLVTYPWQTKVFFDEDFDESHDMSETESPLNGDVVNILKYKKQIILQGPPGTGKTRLAEEIAKEILGWEFRQI